jgi:hypothetical protein
MASAPIVANFSLNQNKLAAVKGRKIEAPAFKSPVAPKRRGALVSDAVMAWRRENGRVGVRNHVVMLPLDDLSNTACEAVANNVKGVLALPHAYGRLQFGKDLELHFRTLIGIGSNPNVAAVVVIGIEDGWTKIVVDGIAKTGKPVVGFGIEGHGDIAVIAKASYVAKEFVQWATELQREKCPVSDLWVSTKCGESDTTTGLSSCPAVGNMYDKLIPKGIYGVFGETSEITGAEHLCKARAATPEVGERWFKMWKAYQDEVIEAHKTSDRQPAHQGQHRGRAHHHRGEGARQSREDRSRMPLHRHPGAGRGACEGTGALLHGHVLGGGRMRDTDGGGRLRHPHLPDRTGQCYRQPDCSRHQDHRQPEDHAHHAGAHRCRRLRHPAPGHDDQPGGRCPDRQYRAHGERTADGGGGPRPP